MRQVPNLRYTARGRPHNMHRLTARVLNFGGLLAAAIFDLLAMDDPVSLLVQPCGSTPAAPIPCRYAAASPSPSVFNGIPIARRNSRASSSESADVTSVMFMPCGRVNLSGLISGNTICSESPRL
jgi:hypothetical protein